MSSYDKDPFYLRYYTGHSGKHGHEFLEFEYSHGRLRYANNSNYRNDSLIRKESAYIAIGFVASTMFGAIHAVKFFSDAIHLFRSRRRHFINKVWVGPLVVKELKHIVEQSEITKEDDTNWPKKNIVGKQELEIRVGNDHIAFETAKIGSLADIQDSEDPEGLRVFYYLVQDLRLEIVAMAVLYLLLDLPSLQDQAYLAA
ncbi:hypothetical protein EW146_g7621 [Bondarzewia mesenterica]|uniref:Mago nashi protein n=1 Tax=Bondarzewia mesenterica TaxID=1095465 RepID=A0A4S4LK89_9AGAM|nr:hypothetical protein EW146_g7621 [Bondarzewia mesenterica]